MLSFLVFYSKYQCNRLPGKTRLWNDLLCVEWDVKPYTLSCSLHEMSPFALSCLMSTVPHQTSLKSKKVNGYSTLWNHLSAVGNHMPYGITQCYLPPGSGDFPAFTPAEAGTRLMCECRPALRHPSLTDWQIDMAWWYVVELDWQQLWSTDDSRLAVLQVIVGYPQTKPLTSEEKDLVWKFRFYLSSQKKVSHSTVSCFWIFLLFISNLYFRNLNYTLL